jgi:hypothetical protein
MGISGQPKNARFLQKKCCIFTTLAEIAVSQASKTGKSHDKVSGH